MDFKNIIILIIAVTIVIISVAAPLPATKRKLKIIILLTTLNLLWRFMILIWYMIDLIMPIFLVFKMTFFISAGWCDPNKSNRECGYGPWCETKNVIETNKWINFQILTMSLLIFSSALGGPCFSLTPALSNSNIYFLYSRAMWLGLNRSNHRKRSFTSLFGAVPGWCSCQ